MKIISIIGVLFVSISINVNALTVDWVAGGQNYLYDSSGSQLITDGLLIQLIIDVNNDTVVNNMISSAQLGIGSETELGGVSATGNSSDDIVGAWLTGSWTFSTLYGYHFANPVQSDVTGYTTRNFYLRWFNAGDQGSATEAGLIFNPTWQTAASDGDTQPAVGFNYGTAGVSGSAYTAGANDGWATVAPVPEPTTMALMGLGLVAVAARRRFAKKA